MKALKGIINKQKTNFPLDQVFFKDQKIFDLDLKTFFFNQWIILGHESRIKKRGEYFLSNVGDESIIVVRGDDNKINCFYNVCRHRGSRICLENEGKKRLFVCPYHAWGYSLDGKLKNASMMDENFDPKNWSLHTCNSKVYEGLIFINFSDKPDSFKNFITPLKPFIEMHGLSNSKIAFRKTYPTSGNWKLALDNFHECYHCSVAHPEYCEVHSASYIQAYGAGSNTGPSSEVFMNELNSWNKKAKKLGHHYGEFSEKEFSNFYRSAERTPFSKDRLSETRSGKPASILMGKFKEFDGGYTTIGMSPFNSLLMSNDFATLFTFIPKSPMETDVEIMWLVDKKAIEGIDYNIDDLIWMWDKTTVADKKIIENNQKGVLSKKYVPGPLSTMEAGLENLKNWYLKHLKINIK